MYSVLLSLYLIVSVLLIGLILVQHGKGASMGASFGAGASNTVFGSTGNGNFLTHSTAVLATLFFAISLGLSALYAHDDQATADFENLQEVAEQNEAAKKVNDVVVPEETKNVSEDVIVPSEVKEEAKAPIDDAKAIVAEVKEEVKAAADDAKANVAEVKEEVKAVADDAKANVAEVKEEVKAAAESVKADVKATVEDVNNIKATEQK